MKRLPLLLGLLCLPVSALANPALEGVPDVGHRPAPAELSKDAYVRWAEPIVNAMGEDLSSPFTNIIFDWYEAEKNKPLPAQISKDPHKIYADTDTAKRQTIQLEDAREIKKFVTAGANVYAEITGTVDQALEATLVLWGKPVGKTEGKTKPDASPTHANRANYFAPNPKWGQGAFASIEIRKNGGVVNDLSDRYLVLVRGDSQKGYDVLMQYIGELDKSETRSVLAIAMIRPLADGKVSHKIASRYMGQSYALLGNYGRENYAFNNEKVRLIEQTYVNSVKELRTTGKIADKTNNL